MALKLMYITNNPEIAVIAENAGVDRIFVDMEYIGKDIRQGRMNTVKSNHTLGNIIAVKKAIKKSKLLVGVNPIHDKTDLYTSSKEEITRAIENGADIIMLPYFKTIEEVKRFIDIVGGRSKTMLLVETPEAVAIIDDILKIDGIDECHIGLNDLSIGYGMKFMFEPLVDGTVEYLCEKFREKGLSYGFGGIASLGHGLLPAENVIIEHYRLGSSMAILSRSFYDINKFDPNVDVSALFNKGVAEIRAFEKEVSSGKYSFETNRQIVIEKIKSLTGK